MLNIYITGANTLDRYNLSKRKILHSSTVWENTIPEKYEVGIIKEEENQEKIVGRDAAIFTCLRAAAPYSSLNW